MPSRSAAEFVRLVDIMATLRAPDGCPWDREQTIDSLKPFVLEETYEVLEAIDRHDHAASARSWAISCSRRSFSRSSKPRPATSRSPTRSKSVADKLVRRHPHVFAREAGDAPLDSAGQVRTRWEEIKAQERGGRAKPKTLLGGVPAALPSLLRAYQIGLRAASVGFDWTRPGDVVDKIQEEVDELREVAAARRSIGSAPKKRWAICCSRSPTCRASSASSPKRRCARRTRSSPAASRRWNGPSPPPAEPCGTCRSTSSNVSGNEPKSGQQAG